MTDMRILVLHFQQAQLNSIIVVVKCRCGRKDYNMLQIGHLDKLFISLIEKFLVLN